MLPDFKANQPFGKPGSSSRLVLRQEDADLLNAVIGELRRAGNLTGTPPVYIDSTASERRIALAGQKGFSALLSGSTSPYSFAEQDATAGGGWAATPGGRTGTNTAYELNAKASLGGKVVWLEPGYPDDYRFQYVMTSATPGIPVPGCCGSNNVPAVLTATLQSGSGFTGWSLNCPAAPLAIPCTYNAHGLYGAGWYNLMCRDTITPNQDIYLVILATTLPCTFHIYFGSQNLTTGSPGPISPQFYSFVPSDPGNTCGSGTTGAGFNMPYCTQWVGSTGSGTNRCLLSG